MHFSERLTEFLRIRADPRWVMMLRYQQDGLFDVMVLDMLLMRKIGNNREDDYELFELKKIRL